MDKNVLKTASAGVTTVSLGRCDTKLNRPNAGSQKGADTGTTCKMCGCSGSVGQGCVFTIRSSNHPSIHPVVRLNDRSVTSPEASSQHSAIWCYLFRFPVASRFSKVIQQLVTFLQYTT